MSKEKKSQIFLDNLEKFSNFQIQNVFFDVCFLDWYYQNGKTLIRDYSIPDQRTGFNPRFYMNYTHEI